MSYLDKLPNLNHLSIFQTVAAARSTSQAARAVRRSQPTVTLALRNLEAFVGTSLLERRSSGSFPTEAGRILLARVERLFDQLDEALVRPMIGAPFVQSDRVAVVRSKLSAASMRGFIAIAEHQTLQEAARAVELSRPSLYRIARDLEHTLGKACFEHTGSGLGVNKPGTELARRFSLALRELDYALEEINALRGVIFSNILIGARRTCAMEPLSFAVNEFLASFPRAKVHVADGSYYQLFRDLRHGKLDFLYGALRTPEWATDVREEPLFYDPYSIAMRSSHPLKAKSKVTRSDLAKYDWIMPPPGAPRLKAFQDLFRGTAKPPTNSIETSSLDFQYAMLAASDRITLLTSREAQTQIEAGTLTTIDFSELPERMQDGIVMRNNWLPTTAQTRFMEILRRHTSDFHCISSKGARGPS